MEPIGRPEMSVRYYHCALCNVSEERRCHRTVYAIKFELVGGSINKSYLLMTVLEQQAISYHIPCIFLALAQE
jgi:hypothetical protein